MASNDQNCRYSFTAGQYIWQVTPKTIRPSRYMRAVSKLLRHQYRRGCVVQAVVFRYMLALVVFNPHAVMDTPVEQLPPLGDRRWESEWSRARDEWQSKP